MKKYILDFLRRGLIACGFGPMVLAVLYQILYHAGLVETLTAQEVCVGIFSMSALAFIAGGLNFLYQMERLPLMVAILIHGGVLYLSYLVTYLVNSWLERGVAPILVFSGIFAVGYAVIWVIVYSVVKKNTDKINAMLKKKQQDP